MGCMGNSIKRVMVATVVATLLLSCGANATRRVQAEVSESTQRTKYLSQTAFRVKQAPESMTQQQQREYYLHHFWDEFDFNDEEFVAEVDQKLMMQTLLSAISLSTTPQTAPDYISYVMRLTTVSKPMMLYFLEMGNTLFYDPNSPYRDDELYIPMLVVALESNLLDEYERMPYESDLHITTQNRVGELANDVELTLPSGEVMALSDVEADYTLLFISNPGCPMCRDVKQDILHSQLLSEMIASAELQVVVLYPDADIDAWRESLSEYPTEWINGYDAEQMIESEDLYDLKAIPSLYLLDADKRVVLKDCVSVSYIEQSILY